MSKCCERCSAPLDERGRCPQCEPKTYPATCAICASPVDPITGFCSGCGAQAAELDSSHDPR